MSDWGLSQDIVYILNCRAWHIFGTAAGGDIRDEIK